MQSAVNVGEFLRTYILMKYLKSITPVLEKNSVTDACSKNPMNNYNIRGHLGNTSYIILNVQTHSPVYIYIYIYLYTSHTHRMTS